MDHVMRCPALIEQTTLLHDIPKRILRRVLHRAGISSSLEPALCQLPGFEQEVSSSREGHSIRAIGWGDILQALRQVINVTDISIVHPIHTNTLSAAAAEAGAVASR
jgi:hypothetical protein